MLVLPVLSFFVLLSGERNNCVRAFAARKKIVADPGVGLTWKRGTIAFEHLLLPYGTGAAQKSYRGGEKIIAAEHLM